MLMNKKNYYQKAATAITIIFILFSIYLVYDASTIWAGYKYNDPYFYLKRQSIYGVLAIVSLFIGQKINIKKYQRLFLPFLILSLLLLVLVLIPGIGIMKGGSYSWLGFSFFSFQPSDFYKFALILFFSLYLEKNYKGFFHY